MVPVRPILPVHLNCLISENKCMNSSGQGTIEYILVILIVFVLARTAMVGIDSMKLSERLLKPVREDYAQAFKYGHPKAVGADEINSGIPSKGYGPPRGGTGGANTRMFINPQQ